MQQAPIKDKNFGIIINHETKFADVRHKALKEYIHRKAKRKKDKTTPVPAIPPGKLAITSSADRNGTKYYLFEVIDFCLNWNDTFEYFGILLKTTDKTHLDKIGRIYSFYGADRYGYLHGKKLIRLSQEDIKWLKNKETGENNET